MSAMKVIDEISDKGGKCFIRILCGLVAPESDRWNYKFTWAPCNVVLAGQGVQLNLFKKERKYIPYCNLFRRTEFLEGRLWSL
jgi:hypothetical protein